LTVGESSMVSQELPPGSGCSSGPFSKVPGLGRRRPPIVVAPVDVLDGRADQFSDFHIIKTIDIDGIGLAAQLRRVRPAEGMDAAMPAEQMVDSLGAELVIGEFSFARNQPEVFRLDEGEPVPLLGAYGTVAFKRACAQIDLRLIADCAAVTAADICLFHGWLSH